MRQKQNLIDAVFYRVRTSVQNLTY